MKEIRADIGRRIRDIREEKGMTQDDLAMKTGLRRNNISAIENGKYDIRIDTLHKIAEGLDVSIELIKK